VELYLRLAMNLHDVDKENVSISLIFIRELSRHPPPPPHQHTAVVSEELGSPFTPEGLINTPAVDTVACSVG
jgi:hypothetical protein